MADLAEQQRNCKPQTIPENEKHMIKKIMSSIKPFMPSLTATIHRSRLAFHPRCYSTLRRVSTPTDQQRGETKSQGEETLGAISPIYSPHDVEKLIVKTHYKTHKHFKKFKAAARHLKVKSAYFYEPPDEKHSTL